MNQVLLMILILGVTTVISTILFIIKSKKVRSLIKQIHINNKDYTDTLNKTIDQYKNIIKNYTSEQEALFSSTNSRFLEEISNRNREIDNLTQSYNEVVAKYSSLIDRDKEIEQRNVNIDQLKEQFNELNGKYQIALDVHDKLEKEIDLFNDTLEIRGYGLYEPKYNFDFPEQYKLELERIYQRQKALVSSEFAVECRTEWTVQGSKAEGKKMTKQYVKLMLYAFNGECDALISKVKWNNATKTEERIRHAFLNINKLGQSHTIQITTNYLQLKLDELHLTYEYELKKQEEKEEQRRIREQMREEEKAQREFERAEREAEEEERKYQKALEKAKLELGFASKEEMEALNEKIGELEKNLQEAKERKERAISQAQLTKIGHIYVISNLGSFGENVYKIGMTRRLDPLDRIKELGDASVPFQFDVHAIIYSENAPQLEYEIHKRFNERRVNRINGKKEFFKITLDEIETFIKEHTSAEIQFTKLAEAKEFRETLSLMENFNAKTDSKPEVHKYPESLFG